VHKQLLAWSNCKLSWDSVAAVLRSGEIGQLGLSFELDLALCLTPVSGHSLLYCDTGVMKASQITTRVTVTLCNTATVAICSYDNSRYFGLSTNIN